MSEPLEKKPAYRVEPARSWPGLELGELWQRRDLMAFLASRDIKLQFKQTALGAIWAVAQPFAMALVFSLVFGFLLQAPIGDMPYLLFFFAGLVPFNLFVASLNSVAQSVVGDAQLVNKVYFPRLVFPIAALGPPIFDAAFASLVLMAMAFAFGYWPGWTLLLLPLFIAMALLSSFGIGLWFCAINVRYRDARYLLPLLTTLWLYITPVFYPASLVTERAPQLAWLYSINPMVGVVEGVRFALVGQAQLSWLGFALANLASILVLVTGLFYFRRCEETFADEL